MNYINMKTCGRVETVDEFETRREARAMLDEYQMAFGGIQVYLSSRCSKDWRESSKPEEEIYYCKACGREEFECSTHPCEAVIAERNET